MLKKYSEPILKQITSKKGLP